MLRQNSGGPPDNFEELVSTAQKAGLVVSSMAGHQSLGDGLNKKENHDRIEAELIKSIEIAKLHGIPGLICFSGNRNPGQTDGEARKNTIDGLLRVAPFAEKSGINLNLELLNSKIDHPGYQCDHTAWGVDVVRAVNSPRVKLLYDIITCRSWREISFELSAKTLSGLAIFTPPEIQAAKTR